MHLLTARWFYRRHMGKASLSITSLSTSKEPFCACVGGRSPGRVRNCVSPEQSPASSLSVLLFLPWSFSPQGRLNCFLLRGGEGSIYLLPQDYKKTVNHGFIKLIQKRDWICGTGIIVTQVYSFYYGSITLLQLYWKSESRRIQYTVPLDPSPLGIVY